MSGGVVAADVARQIPAVRRERGGRGDRISPVARGQRWPGHQDFAVIAELHLDRRDRPADRAKAVVTAARNRSDAALSCTVALHHNHAQVFPGLLE